MFFSEYLELVLCAEVFTENKQVMRSRRSQMAPSTVNNKRPRALMSVWKWSQPHQCSVGTHRQSAADVQTPATRLTNRMTSALHNIDNNNRGGMPILGSILFTSHSLLCNGQNARQMLSGGFIHYVLKKH